MLFSLEREPEVLAEEEAEEAEESRKEVTLHSYPDVVFIYVINPPLSNSALFTTKYISVGLYFINVGCPYFAQLII